MHLKLFWLLLFTISVFASEGAGPSSSAVDSEELLPAFRELFERCFDPATLAAHRYPNNALFTIKTIDEFRDVELSLAVFGDENRCKLEWDAWLVPVGSIKSTNRETGQPVQKKAMLSGLLDFDFGLESLQDVITGITIDIYKNENPHWELTNWNSNDLVSLRFLHSFISLGLKQYSIFCGKQAYLRLSDMSPYREFSWLMKGHGKTLMQYGWNLEYECFLSRMNQPTREQFYNYIQTVNNLPASNALKSWDFEPIPNALNWQTRLRHFSETFRSELIGWLGTKHTAGVPGVLGPGGFPMLNPAFSVFQLIGTQSLKQVVKDFIGSWSNKGYPPRTQIELAQGTFIFFYRSVPNFDLMARQVISGYDDSCYMMTGIPIDPNPYDFHLSYDPNLQQTQASTPLRSASPADGSSSHDSSPSHHSGRVPSRQSDSSEGDAFDLLLQPGPVHESPSSQHSEIYRQELPSNELLESLPGPPLPLPPPQIDVAPQEDYPLPLDLPHGVVSQEQQQYEAPSAAASSSGSDSSKDRMISSFLVNDNDAPTEH